MFQVTGTQIVRFLLERGLRFRNLTSSFLRTRTSCDIVAETATFNAPAPIYRDPKGLARAFFPPFLASHGAFVCDPDLALTVRIRDLNRRFGGLHVSPGLGLACFRP